MWSRFLRNRPLLSTSTIFRNTTSICIGASMAEWVQKNNEDFRVPTWDQVQESDDKHLSKDSNNLQFVAMNYDKLIAEYTQKLEDKTQREILTYRQDIIESIAGRFGLKNKVIVEVGVGTGVFVPNITKAIGGKGCYIGLDISPAFLYYTNKQYESLNNCKLNLSKPNSLELPSKLKGEVDVFFICATYHHLTDVNSILNEMYEYLKPGGKLVIIEFKKHGHGEHGGHEHGHGHGGHGSHTVTEERDVHNIDKEWIKQHLPFTEKQAKEEITAGGFIYEKDIMADNWNQHFIHVYRKPSFL